MLGLHVLHHLLLRQPGLAAEAADPLEEVLWAWQEDGGGDLLLLGDAVLLPHVVPHAGVVQER